MADPIVNLAEIPVSGLILNLQVNQGRNHTQRHLSAHRAVYGGDAGLVDRLFSLNADTNSSTPPFVELKDNLTCLVLAVSGDPVSVSWTVNNGGVDQQVSLKVTKLLVLDQTLSSGVVVRTQGKSQVAVQYVCA